jgi:hypothetical protein
MKENKNDKKPNDKEKKSDPKDRILKEDEELLRKLAK